MRSPIVHNGIVIVSGLGLPITGFRVANKAGQWSTEDAWVNSDVTMDMSTGVVIGDSLFGFSAKNAGQYFALDANTGQTQWLSAPRIAENTAVVKAGNLWVGLTTEAELFIARANTKEMEVLKRYTVADSATWAQPVLSGQRVFIKDLTNVSLWTLN